LSLYCLLVQHPPSIRHPTSDPVGDRAKRGAEQARCREGKAQITGADRPQACLGNGRGRKIGRRSGATAFGGISLSLTASDDAEAQRLFGALSDGDHITMPLTEAVFAASFGVLSDKFGVQWMVLAGQQSSSGQ
jgi:uncharacterized glyoxalase superfamily protein PhnB